MTSNILIIVAPIFGTIAIGYIACFSGLIGQRSGDALADYVFALAVPALIFRTLSESSAPLTSSPWGYWVAYFTGAGLVWILGMVLAVRVFGRSRREAVVHGFSSAQSNTVFIGIPLILRAYGEAGAVPLFLLLAVHLPIMMSAASILIESTEDLDRAARLRRFARTLLTHPILLALLFGLLAQAFDFKLTGVPGDILHSLAVSASPVALVAMGMALARYGFRSDPSAAAVVATLKLVVHPALVYVLGVHVLHLEPVFAGVAVLFAALPSGINGYLLAARYGTGEKLASTAIAYSTAASVATIGVWLAILGVG